MTPNPALEPLSLLRIVCDESRQTNHQYMILGGLVVTSIQYQQFITDMTRFRTEENMTSEFKWVKVSNNKLEKYKSFVNKYFELSTIHRMHFHCMIVDTHQIDNKKYNVSDPEIGFYKLYYQLLLHCFGKRYASNEKKHRLLVHMDRRSSSYTLKDLKLILNNGMIKEGYTYEPFVNVEAIDSKNSTLMQLNDVILGAVGYQKNGMHLRKEASVSKIALAAYIANKAGLYDLKWNTPRKRLDFTIWNFRYRN